MTNNSVLDLWFADLPTGNCPGGLVIEFTFFWKEAQCRESRNYSVAFPIIMRAALYFTLFLND